MQMKPDHVRTQLLYPFTFIIIIIFITTFTDMGLLSAAAAETRRRFRFLVSKAHGCCQLIYQLSDSLKAPG